SRRLRAWIRRCTRIVARAATRPPITRPTTAHVAAPRPGFGSACPDTVNQAGTRNANATTMPSVATVRAPRTRAEASVGAAVSVVGERRAALAIGQKTAGGSL